MNRIDSEPANKEAFQEFQAKALKAKAAKEGKPLVLLLEQAAQQKKLAAIAEIQQLSEYDDDEENDGEEVNLPVAPSTVATITPYQAAQRIRSLARALAKPHTHHLPSMNRLELAINKRISRQKRLEILEQVKAEQKAYFDQNRTVIAQMQQMVQHLPTQENLPNGRAENVLRAIQVVLKNYEKNGGIS